MTSLLSEQLLRILFVEDDETFRNDLTGLIRKRFPCARCDVASSKEEARDRLAKSKTNFEYYDVVILDVQMPDKMGGMLTRNPTVATEVFEFGRKEVPWLLFLTSYIEDDGLKSYKTMAEADAGLRVWFVSKRDVEYPFEVDRILQQAAAEKAIGRWLDHTAFIGLSAQKVPLPQDEGSLKDPVASLDAVVENWALLLPHRKRQALNTFRGSSWELEECGKNEVRLTAQPNETRE